MDVKSTISREEVEALEQWARDGKRIAGDPHAMVLALCETVRAQQADLAFHADCRPNRRQAEAAMADAKATNDRWADEVRRREQAERDEDDLCARLNAALDAAGVVVGDKGYGAAITVLAQQRDAARAEAAKAKAEQAKCKQALDHEEWLRLYRAEAQR